MSSRRAGVLLLLALLVFSLLTLYRGVQGKARAGWMTRTLTAVSAPVQRVVARGVGGISEVWLNYVYLSGLRQENQRLQRELAEARAERDRFVEADLENGRLRRLVDFQAANAGLQMLAARVIAVGGSSFFRVVRVSRGVADGVDKGTAVVTPAGVVGRVLGASDHYADVLLLLDPNSAIDVVVERTRARGVVKGVHGESAAPARLDYLLRTDVVEVGDVLVTSGLDGVFPPGLRVGTIAGVQEKPYGLYQGATVTPAADLTKLEEVLLVVRHDGAAQAPPLEPGSGARLAAQSADAGSPGQLPLGAGGAGIGAGGAGTVAPQGGR